MRDLELLFQRLSLILCLEDRLETFRGCCRVANVPRGRLVSLVIDAFASFGLLITNCDENVGPSDPNAFKVYSRLSLEPGAARS